MQGTYDYYEQGVAAVKAGEYAKARELLKAALKRDPDNERAWLWLSR